MHEFSIESNIGKIFLPKSKEYFYEVFSSYNSGNYRSAIVMLWTVVIFDLLAKLEELESIYEDTQAKKILERIKEKIKKNPKSSEWEISLIEDVYGKGRWITVVEYTFLISLQKDRHLCAHPVIDEFSDLFTPTKDTARAHIRSAMENILIKPPTLSKNIFNLLVVDISNNADALKGDNLKKFLVAKYFKRIDFNNSKSLFRSFWKTTFLDQSNEAKKNREINYRTITIIFGKNPSQFSKIIEDEKDFYSNISEDEIIIEALINFLVLQPKIYSKLNDSAHILIKNACDSDINLLLISHFISKSFSDHIETLKNKIQITNDVYIATSKFDTFLRIGEDHSCKHLCFDVASKIYGCSYNFNQADRYFAEIINPIIEKYDKKNMDNLLTYIEKNAQTYNRVKARSDHQSIYQIIQEKFDSIGFEKYINFIDSCSS